MAEQDPYNAFMSSTLAQLASPNKQADQPQQTSRSFIGSVGGNVIFIGDVPPGALELVIGRRNRPPQQT